MTRKVLSLLLTLCMLLTLLPFGAWAADTQELQETYINPHYADVLDESDLPVPGTSPRKAPAKTAAEGEVCASLEEAGASMREQLKQRSESVGVKLRSETQIDDVGHAIYDAAVVHTGVPTEGDSLAWEVGGWSLKGKVSQDSSGYLYDLTFTVKHYTTLEQEQQMDGLVAAALQEMALDGRGREEQIRTVYQYICDHVVYDRANLDDDEYLLKYTAYAALHDGTAVCQGYALLLYRFLLEAGIDCRLISGDAGGPHAWNIIKLGGVYYCADSTWDAGESNHDYELVGLDSFTDHVRDEDYTTEAFTQVFPTSQTNYVFGSAATVGDLTYITSDSGAVVTECAQSASGTVELPETLGDLPVTGVGFGAFERCGSVSAVSLPATVTSISDRAFQSCDALADVYFGGTQEQWDAVTVGTQNEALTNAALHVDPGVITGTCGENLTWTLDRDGLLTISGTGAMTSHPWDSAQVKNVVIEDGCTGICDEAFAQCEELVSVSIPESVQFIYGAAFDGCTGLEAVYITDIGAWCSIGFDPVTGCNPLQYAHGLYLNGELVTDVTIPDSVSRVGDYAFSGYSALESVVLSEGVTSIGFFAFDFCSSLNSVTLPDTLTSIGGNAFSGCTSLTELRIPDSVTEITDGAFRGCSSLTEVWISSGITNINSETFMHCDGLTDVYYNGTRAQWDAIAIGSYNDPLLNATLHFWGTCGENLTWKLDQDGLLTISGEGAMTDRFGGQSPFYDWRDEIRTVVIEQGVTSIGSDAFFTCSSLESITLPDSLVSIGGEAFGYCSGLTSISIPESVTEISGLAFVGCDGLTSIEIPYGVTEIKGQTFLDCRALTTVTLPETVTTIGGEAFSACEALTDFALPAGVTRIENYAFKGCESLTELALPEHLTFVGTGAFFYAGLENITIPDGMTGIPSEMFCGCGALTSIRLPESVARIGEAAFMDCNSLTDVYYDGTRAQWNAIAIGSDNDPLLNATIHFAIEELAIVSQPQDVTADLGETVSFAVEATGEGLTYQWQYRAAGKTAWANSSLTGSTTGTLQVPVKASRDGQSYRCVITDANGESITSEPATLTIAAQTLPEITVQPQDVAATAGQTALFHAEATGEELTYQWQYRAAGKDVWSKSGLTGSTTDTLQVPVKASRDGQSYRCVITDKNGNSVTTEPATLTLEVQTLPTITLQPQDAAVQPGETAVFHVTATGEGLTYQWQYRAPGSERWTNSGLTGSTTDTLQVQAKASRIGQSYRCVVTNAAGQQVISEAATLLEATSVPPEITQQPQDVTASAGQTAVFHVAATGEGLTYQWQYRAPGSARWTNSGLTGSTTDTLQVPAKASRNGQSYRCMITSASGETVATEPATLTVQ